MPQLIPNFEMILEKRRKSRKKELVIEHTTYEATHRKTPPNYYTPPKYENEQVSSRILPKPPVPPKEYSTRNYSNKLLPAPPSKVKEEDIASHIMTQHRLKKAARRKEKTKGNTNGLDRFITLSVPSTSSSQVTLFPRDSTKRASPVLRRKDRFSGIVMAELNGSDANSSDESLHPFNDLRDAIRSGKMERVIPPWSAEKEELLAPVSRPSTPRSNSDNSIKSPQPVTPEHKSTAKRLAAYVDGKFPSPFNHIRHPSPFSGRESVSSNSSFGGVGDEEKDNQNEAVQALSPRQKESGRRISGEGTSPWYNPTPVEKCRLCGKAGTRGVMGLCSLCERDYRRSTANIGLGISGAEQEIKPTPPLKDQRILSLRKSLNSPSPFLLDLESDQEKPVPPPRGNKENPRLGSVDAAAKPVLETPTSAKFSEQAEIEEDEDSDEETMRRWNNGPFSPHPSRFSRESNKDVFEKWSACYESGEYGALSAVDREVPLILEKKTGMQDKRDTVFYDFWDELLDDREEGKSRR